MKKIIMGMVIGLSLAITPIAFSAYYSGSTSASDLFAFKKLVDEILLSLNPHCRDFLKCLQESQFFGL